MKNYLLLIIISILSSNIYGQISFEQGYYIDNSGQKINCQIKNIDWNNNPTEFEYRLSVDDESKTATLKSVKEFGIYNISKYIRNTVNIDRSSENINNLSNDKKPIFKEEELFLKVLVEGKGNLYQYIDGNLKRYFYNKENSNIEQLIYKKYKVTGYKIDKNTRFKQQLWNDMKCPNFKKSKIESLDYTKKMLVNFFVEYNNCNDQEYVNYEEKQKRDLFNLTIRPRLNNSSLTIRNTITDFKKIDLGNRIGFGFGVEAEFILPFNKNKWAIVIEPTYQNFKIEKTINVARGILISEVDYSSIEIPLGLRHYFFLNKNSKIFINASHIFDTSLKSSIEFKRDDGNNLSSTDIKTGSNLGFGIGYKQNNKYSLELRYQTPREIFRDFILWQSDYQTFSVIFGYSIF